MSFLHITLFISSLIFSFSYSSNNNSEVEMQNISNEIGSPPGLEYDDEESLIGSNNNNTLATATNQSNTNNNFSTSRCATIRRNRHCRACGCFCAGLLPFSLFSLMTLIYMPFMRSIGVPPFQDPLENCGGITSSTTMTLSSPTGCDPRNVKSLIPTLRHRRSGCYVDTMIECKEKNKTSIHHEKLECYEGLCQLYCESITQVFRMPSYCFHPTVIFRDTQIQNATRQRHQRMPTRRKLKRSNSRNHR